MKYTEQERLEAAEWFVDIHDVQDPSPELLQDWIRWLEASESHRAAFAAIEEVWREDVVAQRLPAPPAPAAKAAAESDGYDGSTSVRDWHEAHAIPDGPARPRARARRARRVAPWLAAAAALAGVAVLVGPRLAQIVRPPHDVDVFETRTGEQMQVTLPDGSQVSLGGRSRLSIAYTAAERAVRLESGEAFFTVQKNRARPFRVHVLNGVVTAVGTAFDVRTTNDRVVVAVAEGSVQVNRADAPEVVAGAAAVPPPADRPLAHLRRGESLSFISRPEGRTVDSLAISSVDPAQSARWRDGWLVYRDEPLRDVLADVARYTDRHIEIDGTTPQMLHFTGAVFKDNVLEWLESLPNAFPVTVNLEGADIRVAAIPPLTAEREP